MAEYLELLKSLGIEVEEKEFMAEMAPEKFAPQLIDDATKEYEYWDWDSNVMCVNEPGCERPFALDYSDELMLKTEGVQIHRYSRIDRFKFTVYQLLGLNGYVSIKIIGIVKTEIGKYIKSPSKIWNTIRMILKDYGYTKYYNRIPEIIRQLTGMKPKNVDDINFQEFFGQFAEMSYLFNSKLKAQWHRSYFPNLRYIALRMFERFGIIYPYHIPLVRTFRKKKYLSNLFDDFNK